MNNLLQNNESCNLMVWETAPNRRNKNNEVKLLIPTNQEVKNGDVIIGSYSPDHISCYEILEIKDRRKSAMNHKDYLTVLTKWTNNAPLFSNYKKLTNLSFDRLYSINK